MPVGTPGRTFPSASMPASGPRRARGPLPSPIRPSKRPLPIPSIRCATYGHGALEYPRPAAGPSRRPRPTGRCRHRAHGTPAAHCRRRFAHRSGHSRSTAPAVLLMVASESPLEYPRPAAGPSRRPRPTGRCRHDRHRAHGAPAANCRRRFAHRSGHSRSTAPAVPATWHQPP